MPSTSGETPVPVLLKQLRSSSPTMRLLAASELRKRPFDLPIAVLMEALRDESVGQVRRAINDVVRARDRTPVGANDSADAVGALDLAMLLQHELSPPIGWTRRAGSKEITNFARSNTNDALVRLERRIDGLVALLKRDQPLSITEIELGESLRASWPDYESEPTFSPASGEPVVVETDIRLFELVSANVFQNAIDASNSQAGADPTVIAWGIGGENFWVRVMNPFVGRDFSLDEVAASGFSTKSKHQGIGLTLVETACSRLSYRSALAGRSGIATFTLTGSLRR